MKELQKYIYILDKLKDAASSFLLGESIYADRICF